MKKVAAVFMLAFLAFAGYMEYSMITDYLAKTSKKPSSDNPVEEIPKEPSIEEYSVSLFMAGDALIHKPIYENAHVEGDVYDFTPIFEYIKPIVSEYDLAYYNQETIIGGKSIGLSTYPSFNSPEEIGDALIDAGFNLVSLANNHTLDRGLGAILNSVQYWKGQDGIVTAGSYASFEERNTIPTYEKNGITYAFLSYTTLTNGIQVPSGKEYIVNVYDAEQVKKDVEQVRDQVDIVMVAMHWGEEYTHTPTSEEKEIASYLAELDVDIVIGAHPHVIQPIEFIDDTLVIYSLGNFISSQEGLENLIGAFVTVDITKKVEDGKVTVSLSNVQSMLHYTYYKNYKDYKVIPFSLLTDELLPNYKQIEEEYATIMKEYDDTIMVDKMSSIRSLHDYHMDYSFLDRSLFPYSLVF